MAELQLEGCTPEPLMGYLKALGVLRLVSEDREHGDPDARAAWRDGVFVLETKLDGDGLHRFFLEHYRPTPVVVPWSGGDFFGVDPKRTISTFAKTPTASAIIEAFLATKTDRMADYRSVLLETLRAMGDLGITQKSHIEGPARKKTKAKFLAYLRSVLQDSFLPWLDASAQVADASFAFNALLGSGGGSDGNTHFSDNFMQNLWDCLPDFDGQRARRSEPPDIRSALFGLPARSLQPKRTASLFDSGAVGGPNAGVGMERESLLNPWNFVLALEGTLCLAGAVSKRNSVNLGQAPAFPFAVRMTAVGFGSSADKEQGQHEIWLPIWDRFLDLGELCLLFGSGRCEVGRRPAKSGLDFARAVAGAGIDSGIDAFARFGIVRGRVGGENYNAAVFAGMFHVKRQVTIGLIEQLDRWLESLDRACSGDDVPARFKTARYRINAAIFDFCKYGGKERLAAVLAALGRAERELAVGDVPTDKRRVRRPLAGLSAEWINACDDGSPELRLARSLAFLHAKKTGPIRRYLEPVKFEKSRLVWAERGGHVVWSGGSLARNLGTVLTRRLMDAEKAGEVSLPLSSRFPAALADVEAFMLGQVDDQKLEDLLWGLMLIDPNREELPRPSHDHGSFLPGAYALLKLTLLPWRLKWQPNNGRVILRTTLPEEEGGIAVKPEPGIVSRLRAGDVQGACEVATRQLLASGLLPLATHLQDGSRRRIAWSTGDLSPDRLLAALLFPISNHQVNTLADLVLRRPEIETLT